MEMDRFARSKEKNKPVVYMLKGVKRMKVYITITVPVLFQTNK